MSTDIVAAPRTRSDQAQPGQTPPHAPETGRIRRLLGPFYVTGVFWFRFHNFGVRILPDWLLGPAMVLFVVFFYRRADQHPPGDRGEPRGGARPLRLAASARRGSSAPSGSSPGA